MGEIAEAMLNGLLCEQCGALIDGEEPGYPRICSDCQVSNSKTKTKTSRRSKRLRKGTKSKPKG